MNRTILVGIHIYFVLKNSSAMSILLQLYKTSVSKRLAANSPLGICAHITIKKTLVAETRNVRKSSSGDYLQFCLSRYKDNLQYILKA